MNILAIDGSTTSTGWAIFKDNKLVQSGCIIQSKSKDKFVRIKGIVKEIEQLLIDNPDITKIVMEEVLPEKSGNRSNPTVYKALIYLQCMINFMVFDNKHKVVIEYTYPSEWRAAVGIHTGRNVQRAALKAADIDKAYELFKVKANDDEADAILIGQAYLINNTNNWA